jgi:hypothetical protein
LKVRSFAFFGSFAASTLPLKFPNTTGAPEKEIFPVLRPEKDRTDPEILCSHTLIVMGNFNGNVLAQKKGQKPKKPDFQVSNTKVEEKAMTGCSHQISTPSSRGWELPD